MSTLGATLFTLADAAKEFGPDGKPLRIANLLTQKNEVLLDMVVHEGNLPTGERAMQQTGLPTSYYRLLNQGIDPSKDTSVQVDFQCSILESRTQVDKDLAEMNGNLASFRFRRAKPQIEGMSQKTATTLFYGTSANPEEFVGLASYYNAISGAANADNIIDAKGTGSDNASIYLIGWGDDTICGVYPKGSKAGFQHEDLGLQDAFDASNRRFRAYLDWWQWKLGLAVIDWRYCVRICNIDVSDLVAANVAAADLVSLMSRAIDIIPSFGDCRPAFYCNRTVRSLLRDQAMASKKNTGLTVPEAATQFGHPVRPGDINFLGIPVRLVDKLTKAEARVV
jgi:hypothetical protein